MTLPTAEPALVARAQGACELCGAARDLYRVDVPPADARVAERAIAVCAACAAAQEPASQLNPADWHGLRTTIWSETPAVQVASWRLLKRLSAEPWARDLLDQVYLDEDLLAWAEAASPHVADDLVVVKDSNGTLLAEGDSVTLIKDLEVKGAGFTAKRGTLVKAVHLIGDPEHIEGKVNGMTIVLKTMFLKKVV